MDKARVYKAQSSEISGSFDLYQVEKKTCFRSTSDKVWNQIQPIIDTDSDSFEKWDPGVELPPRRSLGGPIYGLHNSNKDVSHVKSPKVSSTTVILSKANSSTGTNFLLIILLLYSSIYANLTLPNPIYVIARLDVPS